MNKKWYSMSKQELLDELNTTDSGLTSKESQKRLEKYGRNVLPMQNVNHIGCI